MPLDHVPAFLCREAEEHPEHELEAPQDVGGDERHLDPTMGYGPLATGAGHDRGPKPEA
jgi:hypothetical protein